MADTQSCDMFVHFDGWIMRPIYAGEQCRVVCSILTKAWKGHSSDGEPGYVARRLKVIKKEGASAM